MSRFKIFHREFVIDSFVKFYDRLEDVRPSCILFPNLTQHYPLESSQTILKSGPKSFVFTGHILRFYQVLSLHLSMLGFRVTVCCFLAYEMTHKK